MSKFVGIELGGTKVNIITGTGLNDHSEMIRIQTRDPRSTWQEVIDTLRSLQVHQGEFAGIGIASFGPINLSVRDPNYGTFLKTPKPGWSHFNLFAPLKAAFPQAQIVFDTDVNGGALGEYLWGGAQGLENFAYVTVGTGVGVGVISNGKPVHGLLHPEAGHILIKRELSADPYIGHCPFHGDCLEGLICGPAILARTGKAGEDLAYDDPLWGILGGYLAQLFYSLALIASPQRILVGGGVGLNEPVIKAARDEFHRLMGGYIEALSERSAYDSFVRPAHLREKAGVLGALSLVG
ncbi:ROK family protein [Asticcacaulis sp. SL142]|uniref:ROK family protein n=1 Tax=Asticcacaulis sp. SL142 TaxID=2995155 RepID=UPI00226C7F7B|nr:ROK family protein [Asticcacaulis sp. SL142]WAC48255.1 ROK family protein [Asticcacaulis sp. SL142]